MLSLNPIMNMPEVTLTFKCGVIYTDGRIDPDSYKFLTWSYVTGNSSTTDASFSHISLAQRVLSVYPHLVDEPNRIVYIDEENDKIAIPCDNIKETLAALRVITKGHLDEHEHPIRVFIQLLPSAVSKQTTGNCQGSRHSVVCSDCKKWPVTGFVYRCIECSDDYNLCGECDTAGKHPQHAVLRFADEQPGCVPEMKQLMVQQHRVTSVETEHVRKMTCTLRAL